VGHAEIDDLGADPISYVVQPGGAPSAPPDREEIWVAQVDGSGEQSLEWDSEGGVWAVVIMNADAARGVSVEADAGVKIDWLLEAGAVLAGVGILLLGTGVVAALVVSRRASRHLEAER